jgi:hypothetical protein
MVFLPNSPIFFSKKGSDNIAQLVVSKSPSHCTVDIINLFGY